MFVRLENMAEIILYLFDLSPPCRAVHMVTKALGLEPTLKFLDFKKKEHLSEEFCKINPEHKAPTMVEGDFVLWESRAIMRYLVDKYGGDDNSLYPKDLRKRAIVEKYLDHDLGIFYRTMLEDMMMPNSSGTEQSQEQLDRVDKAFTWLDKEMKGKQYLTGDDLTIADLSMVAGFAAAEVNPNCDNYPHAMGWLKRLREVPYFMECNKAFYSYVEKMKANKK